MANTARLALGCWRLPGPAAARVFSLIDCMPGTTCLYWCRFVDEAIDVCGPDVIQDQVVELRRYAGAVMSERASGRWFAAALTASAVLTSGCTVSVNTDELPGVYRNGETGGEVLLDTDGTFSATGVSTDGVSGPADFSGRWEFLDNRGSSDFVYLSVDDGGLGRTVGIQLYTKGQETVYFRHDPDGPPTLELTRVTAP